MVWSPKQSPVIWRQAKYEWSSGRIPHAKNGWNRTLNKLLSRTEALCLFPWMLPKLKRVNTSSSLCTHCIAVSSFAPFRYQTRDAIIAIDYSGPVSCLCCIPRDRSKKFRLHSQLVFSRPTKPSYPTAQADARLVRSTPPWHQQEYILYLRFRGRDL